MIEKISLRELGPEENSRRDSYTFIVPVSADRNVEVTVEGDWEGSLEDLRRLVGGTVILSFQAVPASESPLGNLNLDTAASNTNASTNPPFRGRHHHLHFHDEPRCTSTNHDNVPDFPNWDSCVPYHEGYACLHNP